MGLELLLNGKQLQGRVPYPAPQEELKKKNQPITQTKNTLNAEVIIKQKKELITIRYYGVSHNH